MPDFASGTITLLFTDIEGSTRLVRTLRERWPDVRRQHSHIVRQAFASHGGREIDSEGDSFFFVFPRARDAVLGAWEVQRALAARTWADDVELQVRIGIHTGQASADEAGRYTGLAVHRAARICSAAHGGQVLVSATTQSLLEAEEEELPGLELRHLGEQRLKDFDRPFPLFQLHGPGLKENFPALRTAAAPFAGREDELATAAAEVRVRRLRSRRALTLTAVAAILLAVVIAATVLVTRSGGGLSAVRPNAVGLIDPRNDRIVGAIGVGIEPGPIVFGADAVWVGNEGDRTLTRIAAEMRQVNGTVTLDERTPTGLAAGRGAIWVAHGLSGNVSRVDPRYDSVTGKSSVTVRSNAGNAAVGGGFVWASFGDSTVAKLSPTDGRVVARAFAGASPTGVAYGDGSLWVANGGDATVSRFAPRTFEQGAVSAIPVGRGPSAIAFGAGAVWVTNGPDNSVSRIDPATDSQITIPVGKNPSAIAFGFGAVWVANGGDGTVSRIDPTTSPPKVVKTIRVGNSPAGIAVGGGFVWVTNQGR